MCSRRLDQDEYIRLSHTSSEEVFKTSSRRHGEDQYICLDHTSSRRLQVIFRTSSRQFKTSSRHLQDVLQRSLQNVFETSHHVKLLLLTRLRDLFNTFLTHIAKTVIYRMICLGHTPEKFMVNVQNLQEW